MTNCNFLRPPLCELARAWFSLCFKTLMPPLVLLQEGGLERHQYIYIYICRSHSAKQIQPGSPLIGSYRKAVVFVSRGSLLRSVSCSLLFHEAALTPPQLSFKMPQIPCKEGHMVRGDSGARLRNPQCNRILV